MTFNTAVRERNRGSVKEQKETHVHTTLDPIEQGSIPNVPKIEISSKISEFNAKVKVIR